MSQGPNYIDIGVSNLSEVLTVPDSASLPAQPSFGAIRFIVDSSKLAVYNGTAWVTVLLT